MGLFSTLMFCMFSEILRILFLLNLNLIIIVILLLLFVLILLFFIQQHRKSVANAYEVAERKYKNFTEVAKEGLIIHKKGIIIEVNNQFIDMIGYTKGQLIGKHVFFVLDDNSIEDVKENLASCKDYEYELAFRNKQGDIVVNEVIARSHEYKGDKVRVAVCWDISKRKEVEQQKERLMSNLRESNQKLNQSKEFLSE